jgi:hypothetical protein
MRVLCILLLSTTAFLNSVEQVQEGELWTASLKTDVPPNAYPALQNYLTALIDSRPLPWPFYLEKASVADAAITVQGRTLRSGTYCLPLGVFVWKKKTYVLPSFTCTSTAIKLPLLSVNDMLLPFPEAALFQTSENREQLQVLLERNQALGYTVTVWQERLRHTLAIVGLLLICLPIVIQLWRWKSARRPSPQPIPISTAAETLREVLSLRQEGQTPWQQLVFILNKEASTFSLTTFELEQLFASLGRPTLAKAAAAIEEHGYRPDNERYFDQTVRLIKEGLKN